MHPRQSVELSERHADSAQEAGEPDASGRRSSVVARVGARWSPLALAAVAIALITAHFDTPWSAIGLYALYVLLTAVVPGTLLWRMLRIKPNSALEEIAAGSAIGLTVQVLLTFVLGRIGVSPRFAPLWCLIVVVASLVIPSLRRNWRSRAARSTSPWMAWVLAAISVTVAWWIANTGFRQNPIAPVRGFSGQYFVHEPYIDFPFHQALAAAVLRGGDAFPFVTSVPLQYTLMVYEHMADVTRWTGVDLTLVLMRLDTAPLAALAVVLCGVLAHRVSGSAIAGAFAGVLASLVASPWLYKDVSSAFGNVQSAINYWSPTLTFGEPIFLVLLLLIVILLRERRASGWVYAATVPVAFVAGGSKATFLPLALCGLALALVIGWLVRARKTWPLLILMAISAAAFLLSLELVDGTNSRGLKLSGGSDLLGRLVVAHALGPIVDRPLVRAVAIVMVIAVWVLGVIAGLAPLVLRRRDIVTWLLAGVGVAGIFAAIFGSHPDLSQVYFLRSASPVFGVLAATGFSEMVRRTRTHRASWLALVASLAVGLGLALVIRPHVSMPTVFQGVAFTYAKLFLPYAALVAAGLVAGAAVYLVARFWAARIRILAAAAALPLAALVAFGVVQGAGLSGIADSGLMPERAPQFGQGHALGVTVPADGAEAARWLREHSATTDVVATNMHCLSPTATRRSCDPRNFWLAALAERDVLLEGWAYSTPSSKVAPGFEDSGPFWDPSFLKANDAVVYDPSPAAINWLRAHSVKWVFADSSAGAPSPELGNYLHLVWRRGGFLVYQVP